ncbi:MAG: flagellar hook-length control protein FliK [Nitrospira sp.]|nr:flagellar hook-length control protein FliK [Nitrospira sp.]
MEPLRLHITEFIPLASERPEPWAVLNSGEAVQATVLELLDDGRMVVSVKGLRLKASSLAGPLRIGQVLQARVERSDGQILLKLDPLPGPSAGRQPGASDSGGLSIQAGSDGPEKFRQIAARELPQAAQLQSSRQAGLPDPVAQLLRALLPADESFVKSFQRLLKTVREAVKRQALPEQAGEELEQLALRLLLNAARADGPGLKEALEAKGLQYERSLRSSAEQEAAGPGNSEASGITLKKWLLEVLKVHGKGAYDETAAASGAEEPASARAPVPAWVKDAQQMLKVIEREQVLNALNVQQGLPLMLNVPLTAGPVASLFLYVVQPDGEGAGQEPRPSAKPYSLVTLLELDGIGSIRVDALLTGTRLAARVMVERPEIDQAMALMLPVLRQGLTSQGFQVEGLSSTVADPALVRGEDLPVPTAAARNLLNLKI